MSKAIHITGRAARHLKKLLDSRSHSPGEGLRLVPAPGGQAGLVLGHVREQDAVVKADGVPLLLVEAALLPVLKGATLDYREEPEGRRLTLKI